MLVLSWKRAEFDVALYPGVARTDPQTAEERKAEEDMRTGPGLVRADGLLRLPLHLGVRREEPSADWSDLSIAVEDVQARFGRTIDDFIREPTGTMSVVLSRQIILTPEQKQVAIEKLRQAFAEYQRLKAEGNAPRSVDERHEADQVIVTRSRTPQPRAFRPARCWRTPGCR